MGQEILSPSASIKADPELIAKVVLMPGDPLRAKKLAETYFTDPVCFNTVRNMLGFTGLYRGRRISVMGSGMGIPSMSIYSHELFCNFGVEAIIRIGTAGGLTDWTRPRDIVIASSASTDSAFITQYDFPASLSPTADFSLLRAAVEAAEAKGKKATVAPVLTTDHFYHPDPTANEKYRAMGMSCVEMETAGLYCEAMACGKKALSILSISNHMFTGEELSSEDRQNSLTSMMEVALDTAWKFAE